jgi:hypothetical protein
MNANSADNQRRTHGMNVNDPTASSGDTENILAQGAEKKHSATESQNRRKLGTLFPNNMVKIDKYDSSSTKYRDTRPREQQENINRNYPIYGRNFNHGANESKGYHRDNSMRRSHDTAQLRHASQGHRSNGNFHASKDEFSFDLTAEDENICRHTAASAYETQFSLEIDVELAQCLTLTAMVHDRALFDHAQKVGAYMHGAKQRAISEWLKSKSEEEQTLYLKNYSKKVQITPPQPQPEALLT